jgi:ABC-2 type transport system ATP-binding protein
MSKDALSISGVLKTQKTPFSRRPGFRLGPIDFALSEGEIVGLLGANGAGKTTTLKLLLGLLVPDAGRIELMGTPSTGDAWRSQVGYLPEQPAFYEYLSGREFLAFAAELFGMDRAQAKNRISSLLERVGLAASGDRPIRTYSKGMQQRLGLAQALLNEPKLLILDEPMSGLDPLGRRFVRDLILELKAAGCSVLFSTHIISDAEFICDRVVLMRAGALVAVGTFDQLLGLPSEFEIVYTRRTEAAGPASPPADRVTARVPQAQLPKSLDEIIGQGGHLISVQPIRASVEDLLAAPAPPPAAEKAS